MSTESIGDRLLLLRQQQGLSQRDVSSHGVTAVYVCRIEKGQRVPSVTAIRKLAAKLGVSAEYLETGCECDVVGCGQPGIYAANVMLPLGQEEIAVRLNLCGDDIGLAARGLLDALAVTGLA